MKKLLVLAVLAFAVAACGVKNDLVKPNGQATTKGESQAGRKVKGMKTSLGASG